MKTISVKTSELEGKALNWAVSVAEGISGSVMVDRQGRVTFCGHSYSPSADASGFYNLLTKYSVSLDYFAEGHWVANCCESLFYVHGNDPLIAVCRAIAAAHWGEYADIPEKLVEHDNE